MQSHANNRTICALNTHFWWQHFGEAEHDALRVSNAARLTETAETLITRYHAPVVAMGDLNSTLAMPTIPYLTGHGWQIAREQASVTCEVSSHHGDPVRMSDGLWHGTKTEHRFPDSIDHILYKGNLQPTAFSVIEDADALDASDHSPLLCHFEA